MNEIGVKMEEDVKTLTNNLTIVNRQLDYMNYSVGGMRDNFSPRGMAKSMLPF